VQCIQESAIVSSLIRKRRRIQLHVTSSHGGANAFYFHETFREYPSLVGFRGISRYREISTSPHLAGETETLSPFLFAQPAEFSPGGRSHGSTDYQNSALTAGSPASTRSFRTHSGLFEPPDQRAVMLHMHDPSMWLHRDCVLFGIDRRFFNTCHDV